MSTTVCVSPNGGDTTASPEPATTLLVGTLGGIYRLERPHPEFAWELADRTLAGRHISSILSVAPGRLLAGIHGGGLFASDDDGQTWSPSERGIAAEHRHVFTLTAQQRGERTVLWAGTEPSALYRSDDFGATWTELPALRDVPDHEKWTFPPPPHLAHLKHVAFHPREPQTLYVCIEQGAVLKSTDDGASWNEITSYTSPDDFFYRDVHRIVIAPSNPARVYLASGEGLYRSDDAGTSWTHLTRKDDRVGYPDALFLDPADENTVFIGGASGMPGTWRMGTDGTANAGIIRSRDAGATWHELDGGLPRPVRGNIEAVSLHAHGGTFAFYAGTAVGEVFASEDRGETWRLIAAGLPPISKVSHYKRFLPPSAQPKPIFAARPH